MTRIPTDETKDSRGEWRPGATALRWRQLALGLLGHRRPGATALHWRSPKALTEKERGSLGLIFDIGPGATRLPWQNRPARNNGGRSPSAAFV
jgi:hypothetical protein